MAKAGRGWIKDIIIVGIGVLTIWIGLQVVFGTTNPFYVVSSGSMVPKLQVFDVLVVDGKVPFTEIEIGDIIVFDRPEGQNRVIVHRVVAVIDEDPYTIRTKGDANPASIPGTDFPITEDEYIGEVYAVIPQIGYVTRILSPPINYIIIGIIIVIMVVKQITKGKREHEMSDAFDLESEKNDKPDIGKTSDELEKVPKDKEYTEISDEVRKAAFKEEGLDLPPDNKNKPDDEDENDKSKKKPEE